MILFKLAIELMLGPTIDAMIEGISFGVLANTLNDGEFLWNMDK